jgi:hypothetical protein
MNQEQMSSRRAITIETLIFVFFRFRKLNVEFRKSVNFDQNQDDIFSKR